MHFLENLFGLLPDNDTGATEVAIWVALCAVIVGVAYHFHGLKRLSR